MEVTNEKISKITNRQRNIRKRCEKFKEEIHKIYPGAFIKRTRDKFFVVDAFGCRILRDENKIESSTIIGAWEQTSIALHCSLEITRNSTKFNDEAVLLRMLRKLDAGDRMS